MSRNEGRVNPSEDEALEQEEPTPMSYPTRPPSSDDSGFNWTNPTYFVDLPSKGKVLSSVTSSSRQRAR